MQVNVGVVGVPNVSITMYLDPVSTRDVMRLAPEQRKGAAFARVKDALTGRDKDAEGARLFPL